jgi:IS1 family transposase
MNCLSASDRARVVACLIEGSSIRSTVRLTGVCKDTVLKLLCDLGVACKRYHDANVRNLRSRRVQCDETWNFCYGKDKNITDEQKASGAGSAWTWIALDADSKLVVSYLTGGRDASWAHAFMCDVAARLSNRVQLTTDGNRVNVEAVEDAFGSEIDYAKLLKIYGSPAEPDTRYSPAQIIETRLAVISGDPDVKHISTSYVERQNLTMRMSMRRFTRLTNAFSKKIENLRHAVALNYMHYNFCRIPQSLRITPAMAAGITDHIWSIDELVALLVSKGASAAA